MKAESELNIGVIPDMGKTATDFISETETGIKVHPEGDEQNFVYIDNDSFDIYSNGKLLATLAGSQGGVSSQVGLGLKDEGEIIISHEANFSKILIQTPDGVNDMVGIKTPTFRAPTETIKPPAIPTFTGSGGSVTNWNFIRSGQVCQLSIMYMSSSQWGNGGERTVTVDGIPLPAMLARGSGRYSGRSFEANLTLEGQISIQNCGDSLEKNKDVGIMFTYITND